MMMVILILLLDTTLKFFVDFFSLSKHKKSLLCKSLNYSDYLLPLELLYKDVNFLDIPGNDKEFTQRKLKDYAFASYRDTDKINDRELFKEDASLNSLNKSNALIIQRPIPGSFLIKGLHFQNYPKYLELNFETFYRKIRLLTMFCKQKI